MGQINDKPSNMPVPEPRVPYDETSNNGLVIAEKYIPEELLSEILCYMDYKTLCACQLVCKRWHFVISDYIWRKKAEMSLGHSLPADENAPWAMYYLICHKKPFNKNLMKNHSGEKRLKSHWTIVNDGGDGWRIESPPAGVTDLPEDPIFNGKKQCFVTSYNKCWKYQIINLVEEGFAGYLLDHMQPIIKVSEWYSCRWDCPARYACSVELLTDKEGDGEETILDAHYFVEDLENDDQNKWFKYEHEFTNYGKGLRKIKFSHGGQDKSFWAGHYGSKMAGACVVVEIPESHKTNNVSKMLD